MFRLGWSASVIVSALVLTGCGPSLVKTEGVVNLDGQPIEGADVLFVSDDGTKTFAGYTDAAGKFTMRSGDKVGIPAGTYKVTVQKSAKPGGGESIAPGSADYLKQMEKESKDLPRSKPGAPFMPGAPGKGPGIKSELPTIYAVVTTTPLTAKVPSNGPVVLDLKSKP